MNVLNAEPNLGAMLIAGYNECLNEAVNLFALPGSPSQDGKDHRSSEPGAAAERIKDQKSKEAQDFERQYYETIKNNFTPKIISMVTSYPFI